VESRPVVVTNTAFRFAGDTGEATEVALYLSSGRFYGVEPVPSSSSSSPESAANEEDGESEESVGSLNFEPLSDSSSSYFPVASPPSLSSSTVSLITSIFRGGCFSSSSLLLRTYWRGIM